MRPKNTCMHRKQEECKDSIEPSRCIPNNIRKWVVAISNDYGHQHNALLVYENTMA